MLPDPAHFNITDLLNEDRFVTYMTNKHIPYSLRKKRSIAEMPYSDVSDSILKKRLPTNIPNSHVPNGLRKKGLAPDISYGCIADSLRKKRTVRCLSIITSFQAETLPIASC
ncbi:hypothetical protein EM20IM_01085 [Candidatus Methylacidiphilum infernorum]|uniref:Uncharacterized protein n=1 Tax=Candidatus Methylacidiphilum infernorum TaxID=511746 RepID=A0ABX7PVZ1_9BACT|nr:hypothetical protein [Candidatus Methylacidiphilum infernorum]QSR86995.1 hypothetical protein EM20IM_01085 [Candidatus Methylacidiphilum infernorum]